MKIIFIAIIVLLATTSCSNKSAISNSGNGAQLDSAVRIGTNRNKFEKPDGSSFLLKSINNNSAYWLNMDKWKYQKVNKKSAAEYKFNREGKLLYGFAINEDIHIPLELITDLALVNAQKAASDARIVKKEYRTVNGNRVLFMEMNATNKGIEFAYLGYYFSDKAGSTQLVAFTPKSLVNQYRQDINNLLNGLVVQ